MTSEAKPFLEVALAVRVGVPHLERVVHGIRDYAESQTNWRFLVSPETHDLPPVSLRGWRGDGVIALCNTQADVGVLKRLRCPVVNISGALRQSGFPRVRNDYREIGRVGALHLRNRGFRRLGFYGVSNLWYSDEIEAGFSDFVNQFGGSVTALHSENTLESIPRWNEGQGKLEAWLRDAQTPLGVMAAHDPRAAMVIRACERIGLHVPQDVAVIGSNNDTVTCETCHPQLTSIDRNGYEVGWEAATLLDRLIKEPGSFSEEIVIMPGDVRERESTNTLAVEQLELRVAVEFMKQNHGAVIGVENIATACGRSRRWLEETFRSELGCTPSELLRRIRVEAAERIMGVHATGTTLGTIAADAGFSGTRQMNAAFLKLRGVPAKRLLKSMN